MKTAILEATSENIVLCAIQLHDSQLVGIPTETVYGLASLAFDEVAIEKVFKAKERPTFDPLIVHVSQHARGSLSFLEYLSSLHLVELDKIDTHSKVIYENIMRAFWPGPLTVVLPKKKEVPDLVTSGLNTVAVRVPKHPVAIELIKAANSPLAAPSANRFGRISPTKALDVLEELNGRVLYILDGGSCEIGLESTVVEIKPGNEIRILRPGAITKEMLHAASDCKITEANHAYLTIAPGMLENHYAPGKPLFLIKPDYSNAPAIQAFIQKNFLDSCNASVVLNSRQSDLIFAEHFQYQVVEKQYFNINAGDENVARSFFKTLRTLDRSTSDFILSETYAHDSGIGHAICDRLTKAAMKL